MKLTIVSLFVILYSVNIFSQISFDPSASVKAAKAILETLSSDQKTVGERAFNDTLRLQWTNLPEGQATHHGVQFKDMTDVQHMATHSLLRTVLSQQGYQKFLFIMQYDEGIHERLTKMNSPIANRYGNQNYWLMIFGTPTENKVWSFKFEGHHISLNITFSPKGITCTPMFVGINPALTTTGPYAGYNLMFEENDFGNQLFNSLSDDFKKKATTSAHPKDADVMAQTGKEPFMTAKQGVSYAEMTAKQQSLVENIIRAWVENLAPALAQEKMKKILANKNKLLFTWQGSQNTNELHYYSVKTDDFIIEFTNRDQGIYHYHTLWRDLTEDFKAK